MAKCKEEKCNQKSKADKRAARNARQIIGGVQKPKGSSNISNYTAEVKRTTR